MLPHGESRRDIRVLRVNLYFRVKLLKCFLKVTGGFAAMSAIGA